MVRAVCPHSLQHGDPACKNGGRLHADNFTTGEPERYNNCVQCDCPDGWAGIDCSRECLPKAFLNLPIGQEAGNQVDSKPERYNNCVQCDCSPAGPASTVAVMGWLKLANCISTAPTAPQRYNHCVQCDCPATLASTAAVGGFLKLRLCLMA